MSFDPNLLILSLVPSGIGFVLFTYGRKQHRLPLVIGGLMLLIFPYFADTVLSLMGGSVLIGAGLYIAFRLGW